MPSKKDGVMIVLSSPSGAGKTTLSKMLSNLDSFEISISHTTRKPRPNEISDKDYYFVNKNEFERLIKNEISAARKGRRKKETAKRRPIFWRVGSTCKSVRTVFHGRHIPDLPSGEVTIEGTSTKKHCTTATKKSPRIKMG